MCLCEYVCISGIYLKLLRVALMFIKMYELHFFAAAPAHNRNDENNDNVIVRTIKNIEYY